MLTLPKLVRLAQAALDDDNPEASADLHAWATENAPELARAMAREDDAMRDALLRCAPADFARNLLASCRSRGVRDAVRAQADKDARGEADEASARATAGAVRLNENAWSVDFDALVAVAAALGRGDKCRVAIDAPDGDTLLVPARILLDIARANARRDVTAEVVYEARPNRNVLVLRAGGARGYRLRGMPMGPVDLRRALGNGEASCVSLPADLPAELPAYDAAAE